jgi:hypothetical protein
MPRLLALAAETLRRWLPSQSYCAGAGMGRMLDTFQPLGAFTDHQP